MKKILLPALLILGICAFSVSHVEPVYAASHADNDDVLPADSAQATAEDAESIFGDDCLGKRAIGLTFGQKYLAILEIPNPPYTVGELKKFHRWGFILVYQLTSLDGKPLTIQAMFSLYKGKLNAKEDLIFASVPDTAKEPFYISEVPRGGWKLVTKDVVDASVKQDYMAQTMTLNSCPTDFSIAEVISGIETSEDLATSLKAAASVSAQGDAKREKVADDTTGLQTASRMLVNMKTNMQCRETAVEVFYRMIMYHAQNGIRLFQSTYVWTRSLSLNNKIIGIGCFTTQGMTFDKQYWNTKGKVRGETFCCSK